MRIALNLKSIPFTSKAVNLLKGEQHEGAYIKSVNPSHFVPTLQIPASSQDRDAGIAIAQSVAALEYLEERFPDRNPLLPPQTDTAGRAYVRTLVNVIACDTQPVTNMRILNRAGELGASKEDWARALLTDGLHAYEAVAAKKAGRFSYGDQITLADVTLVPAVWGAMRFGVEMDKLPTVKAIFENMSKEDAVIKAHWKNQGRHARGFEKMNATFRCFCRAGSSCNGDVTRHELREVLTGKGVLDDWTRPPAVDIKPKGVRRRSRDQLQPPTFGKSSCRHRAPPSTFCSPLLPT